MFFSKVLFAKVNIMDTNTLYKYTCLLLVVVTSWSFFRDLIYYLFGVYDIENHKNRLKQLDFSDDRKFGDKKKENDIKQTRELIEKITEPIIRHVMPNIYGKKDLSSLEKSLKFAGADKYFTPMQYTALVLLGRILGVIFFIALYSTNALLACMWFIGPAVLPSFLFKNTIKNKQEVILLGFPEFINISKSYLVSGMSFEKAVEESIYYVNKEWQELLKQFLVNSENYSRADSLVMLAEDSNSFEVKEFITMIKLNAEQGIDIKESFDSQYDNIKDLQKLAINKKIEGRKVWAVLIQAPVLLTIIVAFGLPMVESMMNFTGNL